MCLELKIILFLNLDQRDKFKSICLKIISDIRLCKKKKKKKMADGRFTTKLNLQAKLQTPMCISCNSVLAEASEDTGRAPTLKVSLMSCEDLSL